MFSHLEQIEKLLKEANFDCSLEPQTKAPPFGRVLLFLGNDQQNRERILEITSQVQDLGEGLQEPPKEPQFLRIQFELALPFNIQDNTANEVSSLLFFLNRMLELPGFELDETNSKVFYRYVLLTSNKEVQKPLLTGIIGVITMLLELFSETIERVAVGQNTFEELLEQMLEMTESLA